MAASLLSRQQAEQRLLKRKLRNLAKKPHRQREAMALAARLDLLDRESMTSAEARKKLRLDR